MEAFSGRNSMSIASNDNNCWISLKHFSSSFFNSSQSDIFNFFNKLSSRVKFLSMAQDIHTLVDSVARMIKLLYCFLSKISFGSFELFFSNISEILYFFDNSMRNFSNFLICSRKIDSKVPAYF